MKKNPIQHIILEIINFYQKFVSPSLGQHCRFYPTCSQYGVLAIKKHGVIRGTFLAFWRLLKCNPWNRGGIDLP